MISSQARKEVMLPIGISSMGERATATYTWLGGNIRAQKERAQKKAEAGGGRNCTIAHPIRILCTETAPGWILHILVLAA